MLVAVIDIGKTNKKVVILDSSLRQVAIASTSIPAKPGPDGILVEQVDAIWEWLKAQLGALYRQHPYQAISISTHGATWAGLGDDGLAMPVIAYENDLGEAGQAALDAEFYRRCGALEKLQEETGTCDLPLLINPGKMVLFAQQRLPQAWAKVRRIINYPQFWGWKLTGNAASEPTASFCHTFLHDIRSHRPSSAARALGCDRLLDAEFRRPWDRLGVLTPELQRALGLPALPVTLGVHDSNGSLLPYLVKHRGRDFVLNSTGTWCVAMHPVPEVRYLPGELGTKTIFEVNVFGGSLKVSILMGGQEYALYHELAGGAHTDGDPARLDRALARVRDGVLPGAFPGQFTGHKGGLLADGRTITLDAVKAGERPAWFRDPVLAHDLLNVSLALQTEVALRRTGMAEDTTIFIEGGFRNNPAYCALLAALFPKATVACTNLEQASACGAALLGQAMVQGTDPSALADAIVIEEVPVARPALANLAAYRAAWRAAVGL
jgi:sugar (pentulose or hexulose) kinase